MKKQANEKIKVSFQVPQQLVSKNRQESIVALAWVMRAALKEGYEKFPNNGSELGLHIVLCVIDKYFSHKSHAYRKALFCEAKEMAADENAQICVLMFESEMEG
jgi:hypothetical protein